MTSRKPPKRAFRHKPKDLFFKSSNGMVQYWCKLANDHDALLTDGRRRRKDLAKHWDALEAPCWGHHG